VGVKFQTWEVSVDIDDRQRSCITSRGGRGVSGSAKIQITQFFVKQNVKNTSHSLPICMIERIAIALASLRGVKLGFVRFVWRSMGRYARHSTALWRHVAASC
jgi:hypothetical protein